MRMDHKRDKHALPEVNLHELGNTFKKAASHVMVGAALAGKGNEARGSSELNSICVNVWMKISG